MLICVLNMVFYFTDVLEAVEGTNEAVKIKEDVWKLDLLPVLLLVLKKDYSLTPGGWRTASRLANILRLDGFCSVDR